MLKFSNKTAVYTSYHHDQLIHFQTLIFNPFCRFSNSFLTYFAIRSGYNVLISLILSSKWGTSSTRAHRARTTSIPRTKKVQDTWGTTTHKTRRTREHVWLEAHQTQGMYGKRQARRETRKIREGMRHVRHKSLLTRGT